MDKKIKIPAITPVIILLVLGAVLVVVMALFLLSPRYGANIDKLEAAVQDVGGASVTNYLPTLATGLVWEELTEEDKIGTARYAVNQAISQAKTDGVVNFNVLGLAPQTQTPIFLYSGGDKINIYNNGETNSVPLQ